MLFGDHRVVQRIGLVVELDDRAGQHGAFLDAQPLGERAGRNIAHDDLEWNDLHFLDQLLTHVEAANEVGRDAQPAPLHLEVDELKKKEHALAIDNLVLLLVEGCGVVLEELDQGAGLGAFIKNLGLALINAATTVHGFSWSVA